MNDGMISRAEWEQTKVHKASEYFCGHCGKEFQDPHALYDHLESCEPVDDEIRLQSRVRLTKAIGTVAQINGETVHVIWDTGAQSPVPMAWLTKEMT